MSHDPSSSSAAPAGESANLDSDRATATRDGSRSFYERDDAQNSGPPDGEQSHDRRRRKKKSRKKRNPGLKKKLEFITHLLKGLDSLVFAELSALYYMECSLFRLIIRAVSQVMYLSPKDETFPLLQPASRMHVALVVLPNLWCMLLHLLGDLPQGPEYHRGYQHGGMIIDFVGQKPPVYKLYYLMADIFLLGLQCLMLAVHTEREKLRLSLKTFRPLVADPALEAATARTIEDLDVEEQGIRSSGPSVAEATSQSEGIELQPLRRSTSRSRHRDGADSETRTSSGDDVSRSRLSDILSSGNAVLGDYHVVHCMRTAAMELERSTAQSLQSIGYRATLAAIEARRRGAMTQVSQENTTREV